VVSNSSNHVALADGQILGAILLSQAQVEGRFRTGWFRWSFGFALISAVPISLKPACSALDHIVLAHVSVLGVRILRLRCIGAMVGYSQDTARFQCAVKSL
jgi:hypothetical protein